MTRTKTYILTAVAAVMYVLLNIICSTDAFNYKDGNFWMPGTPVTTKAADGSTVVLGEWKSLFEGSFWVYLFLVLIVLIGVYQASKLPADGIAINPVHDVNTPGQVDDPKNWKLLIGNSYFAILWLPLRFYVGRAWLEAGEHKVFGWGASAPVDGTLVKGGAGWMNGGMGLKGYWMSAVGGQPIMDPATGQQQVINGVAQVTKTKVYADYQWFQDFLNYMLKHEWYTWFAKLIAIGELLVGIGIIVGALVGIAAFFGSFMNMNFMLAGTGSSNPVLFGLTVFLVLGWKVAGYWGLDRYLLPALGTPWHRGILVGGHRESPPAHGAPSGMPAGD